MFRKTFIRLILVITVATTTLIVFAARQNAENSNVSCESKKDAEPERYRSAFMILESLGRTLISTGTN